MDKVKKKTTVKKKTQGRPKFIVDYDLVYKLSKRFSTQEDIADILGCSASTLQHDEKFLQVFNKGKNLVRKNLRVAQYKYALKGNSTLLIWLGKQYLGQKENNVDDDIPNWTQQITIYGMNKNAI